MRKKLSVLLSVLLLLNALTACRHPTETPGASGDSSPEPSLSIPNNSGNGSADSSQAEPEPDPEPSLEYDPDYTLDVNLPKTASGKLELPIQGATGYASVRLGLWEEIPDLTNPPQTEPQPEAVPETPAEPVVPDPSGNPAQSDDPNQGGNPAQSDEPDQSGGPAQSSDPVQDDGPPQNGDPVQDGDPAQNNDPAQGDDSAQSGDLIQSADPTQDDSSIQSAASSALPSDDPNAEAANFYVPDPGDPVEPEGPISGDDPVGETGPSPEEPEYDPFEGVLTILEPGAAFCILSESEDGEWWRVECTEGTGWIQNRYCLINLPDVIPSMVYNATNSYSSQFRTLGREISNVTGRAFYPGKTYNERLGREEFMMPVLYSMSKRICQAQQAALAEGNTLVLYEGYRPHEVQTTVYKALSTMSQKDPRVKEAVAFPPWNISWFIAGGYSNHQRGFAMDVSLARVDQAQLQTIGEHQVVQVLEYREYTMPTPIHELSRNAATFTIPVNSRSATIWKSATLTDAMRNCKPALALQRYCTGAGLTPLASEWWHFNDLDTRLLVLDNQSTGGYKISQCLSKAP